MAILSFIVLSGCALSQEELLAQMMPTAIDEEGCYRFWVVFENEEQALGGEFNIQLSEESRNKMVHSSIHAWDWKERTYTKAFQINEYPTFLVVDHQGVVLQTTSLQEADEFLASQLTECE